MAVPDFERIMLPFLKLGADGQQFTLADAIERLARDFQLSDEDRTQLLRSGQTRFYNRVGWATTYLKKARLGQGRSAGALQTHGTWTGRARERTCDD